MFQRSLPSNPQFRTLRWRLLLSSLGILGGTLAAFGLVVYQVVAKSLEQKSDRQLVMLAQAAAQSLPDIVEHQGAIAPQAPHIFDTDGDLDLPWQSLRQPQQGVEWFDARGHRLGQVGQVKSAVPLIIPAMNSDTDQDGTYDGAIHRLVLPVYTTTATAQTQKLQGYVRVSESNQALWEELERLRRGLQYGSLLALVLSAMGGWWLTRESLQPIEHSMRQLKQFTADASHELRNPLTAIKASVEVMQSHSERFTASDCQKLDAIASATHQMGQLVDDLLWLARTDRMQGALHPWITFPLTELLEEVLDQYLSLADQKHIALQSDFQADVSLLGNPLQLKRLLNNLIANALQYTASGGTVTLSSTTDNYWIILQVVDTGIGIAPDHLPHIFDRFWRADQARGYRANGTGLGLAIAQAIIQQHKGKISVRSELGKGSCFQVKLPLCKNRLMHS